MRTVLDRIVVLVGIVCAYASSSPPPSPSLQAITDQITDYVNVYRGLHGSPNVSYATSLGVGAQSWATHLASIETLQHTPIPKYGENLYEVFFQAPTVYLPWKLAIDSWYNEGLHYNYSNLAFDASTAHFTALIWKATQRIGFGTAKDIRGANYVVAWFDPQGNVQGYYSQNVMKTPTPAPTPKTSSPKPNSLPPRPLPVIARPLPPRPPRPPRPQPYPSPLKVCKYVCN